MIEEVEGKVKNKDLIADVEKKFNSKREDYSII